MIQTRRSPQPPPGARKKQPPLEPPALHSMLRVGSKNQSPAAVQHTENFVSSSIWICFIFPSLLNHRKWKKSFSQDGLYAWQQQNYGLRLPERCFFLAITGVVMGKSLKFSLEKSLTSDPAVIKLH